MLPLATLLRTSACSISRRTLGSQGNSFETLQNAAPLRTGYPGAFGEVDPSYSLPKFSGRQLWVFWASPFQPQWQLPGQPDFWTPFMSWVTVPRSVFGHTIALAWQSGTLQISYCDNSLAARQHRRPHPRNNPPPQPRAPASPRQPHFQALPQHRHQGPRKKWLRWWR